MSVPSEVNGWENTKNSSTRVEYLSQKDEQVVISEQIFGGGWTVVVPYETPLGFDSPAVLDTVYRNKEEAVEEAVEWMRDNSGEVAHATGSGGGL